LAAGSFFAGETLIFTETDWRARFSALQLQ